jgi:ABC-type transport system substrate-binding protein
LFRKTVSGILLFLLLVSTLTVAFNIQPAKAYSEGTTYEEFGSRVDKLLIKLYPNETAEWDALARGEIDIADWPLSKSYYDLFNGNTINPATGLPYNETINTFSFPQDDFFILDINNNNNPYLGNPPNSSYPNPVYPNPTSVKEMRQAIAYLVDRNQLATIVGKDFYVPLYTVVPPWMGEYTHPDIKPGGLLEYLTYPYSRAAAATKLDVGGFPVNPSTSWRFWDRNGNGIEEPDEYLELKFVIRNDSEYRLAFGNFLADELNAVKVRVNRMYCDLSQAYMLVMYNKDFHLYTAGWRAVGPNPDHLMLWTWDYYFHPGWCENYAGINNPDFNTYSFNVIHAGTFDEAKTNAWLAQEVFASEALSVPLWSEVGSKAMSKIYTGGNKWTPVYPDDGENAYRGGYWDGVVDTPGKGIDNSFTFLSMHPGGFERGGTIRWGFKTTAIESFNPIYAEWLWDLNILNSIYDSLLVRNPYNQSELIPWLAQDFEVGTYNNPAYGECSKIRFTLRADATWADGEPITAADVYFTFVELPKMLRAMGFWYPWWYSNVQNVSDFKIFDPYNFEVLLNTKSYFTTVYTAQTIILPKHVWKPIVEDEDPTTFAPDPNMIGSGPYRLLEYVAGSHVLLVANKPGSAVKTNLPGSRAIVSPQGYFRYSPISSDAFTSKINRFTPTEANFNTTIRNNLPDPVTINYVVRHKWPNESITVLESNSAVVIPGSSTLTRSLPSGGSVYGKHERLVDVTIVEPLWTATTISVIEPYWVTEREDLNLDIFVNVQDCVIVGKAFGSYPGHVRWNGAADVNDDYKIDVKDVYSVQRRANASEWRAPEPQPGPVSLTVSPGSAIVTANANFTVNVTVNNVVNLRGYQFSLFYDSTVLDLIKAEPNWIYSFWSGVSQINDNYNSTHGKYTQASYAIEGSSPPSFNGTTTLVTLTFHSVQDGSSFFNLANTLLVDLDAEQIPHVRVPWTPAPPIQEWLFDSDFQYNLDDDYGTVEGTGHLSGKATLSAGNFSIEGQITLNGPLPAMIPEVYLIATDGQDKELAKQAVDLNGFSYWQTGPNTYNFTGQIPNVIQPMNNGHYEAQALITYNTAKYEFFINTASLINSHYFPLTPPPIVPPVPPQPVNIEPPDGATDVSLEPLFLSSPPLSDVTSEQIPWEDIDGVEATRVYYRVQITTIPGDYSEPVYDFTDLWLIDKRFDFPPSPKRPYVSSGVLDSGTTYYWRIRYKDFRDVWSPWSQETSFTTVLPINEVVKRLIQQVRIIEKDTYVTIDEAQYIIVVLRQKIDPDTLSFIPDSGETVVYTDAEGYAISDGEVARKIGLIDIAQETVKELDLNEKINELKSVQSKLSSLNLRDLAWGGINLAATAGADIEKIVNEMTVLKRIGDSLTTIERIEDLAKTQPVGLLQETITYLMRKMIWDPYSEVKVTLDKALSDALNEYTQALNLLEQTSYKIEDFRTANEFLTRLYYGQVHEEVARHLEEKTFKNWGKLVLRILSVANLLQKIPIIKDIPGLDFVALVKEAADALDWLNDADYVHVVKSYEAQANLLYKLSDNAKYTLRLAQASAQVQEYTQKYLDHIAEGNQQGAKLLEEAIPFSSFSRFLDSLRSLKLPALFSPGELRVYDSQNRVTGLIYGHPSEEIPDSLYDDEINIIIIFNATDTYRYEVVGTDKGSYGLEISSIANGSVTTFNATDIPTSTNATHQYTIDWDVLSQGEEGVTVQVDSDGDGVFEHTFTSDSELTHDEFIQQTTPTYNLTITATIGGTTNPSPGMYTYTANSSVQVTAIPNADYLFDHWELDTVNVGSANPYTVLMDNNHTLKAVFTYSPPPPPLSASISPLSASILVGQSVTFTSTVSGGYTPYSYQWYLNGNPVSGATSNTWTFTPTTSGIFYIYLKIIDAKGNTAQSETARVVVYTVPVGGYSIPIQLPTTAKPVTLHIALLTILTALFITIKQKTRRKHRQ